MVWGKVQMFLHMFFIFLQRLTAGPTTKQRFYTCSFNTHNVGFLMGQLLLCNLFANMLITTEGSSLSCVNSAAQMDGTDGLGECTLLSTHWHRIHSLTGLHGHSAWNSNNSNTEALPLPYIFPYLALFYAQLIHIISHHI